MSTTSCATPIAPQPRPLSGIAYLDALVADHAAELRGEISYQPNDPNPSSDVADQEPR